MRTFPASRLSRGGSLQGRPSRRDRREARGTGPVTRPAAGPALGVSTRDGCQRTGFARGYVRDDRPPVARHYQPRWKALTLASPVRFPCRSRSGPSRAGACPSRSFAQRTRPSLAGALADAAPVACFRDFPAAYPGLASGRWGVGNRFTRSREGAKKVFLARRRGDAEKEGVSHEDTKVTKMSGSAAGLISVLASVMKYESGFAAIANPFFVFFVSSCENLFPSLLRVSARTLSSRLRGFA